MALTIRHSILNIRIRLRWSWLLTGFAMILLAGTASADIRLVDFEGFGLPSDGHFNGPVPIQYHETVENWWGDDEQDVGKINVNGVDFSNRQSAFGTWSGFAISNEKDKTTPGFSNPYSAFAGSGANGSSTFAMAFGYQDVQTTPLISQEFVFVPTNITQLNRLPSIYLPANYQAQSIAISNSTYAALSMRDGDPFSKKFGGISGNDPDFFKVSVYGIDAANHVLGTSVDFYLADYRFANNAQDYILNSWQVLDLSALSGAASLHFNVSSSDVGNAGMRTPSYFAIDNLTITAVPEPSSLLLMLGGGLGVAWRYRRRAKHKIESV